jgi:hypothetical protein
MAMNRLRFFYAASSKRTSSFYIARFMIVAQTAAGQESKGVMAAAGDPDNRGTPAYQRSLLADAVTALLTAVLVISTVTAVRALAPVAWDALSQVSVVNMATDPRQCALIKNDRDRLACFDDYVRELMRPPAKGAFAPPGAFGERKAFDAR